VQYDLKCVESAIKLLTNQLCGVLRWHK